MAKMEDDDAAAVDAPAGCLSLVVLSEETAIAAANAPNDNEPASSAGEESSSDSGRMVVPQIELLPGAWATLCGLKAKPELNGSICVLIQEQPPRWQVRLFMRAEEFVSVKPANLSMIAPYVWLEKGTPFSKEQQDMTERAVALVLDEFLESDATTLVFPTCLSKTSRAKIHGGSRERDLEERSNGPEWARQMTCTKPCSIAPASPPAAAAAGADLGQLPFLDVCGLFEKLEEIRDCDSIGGALKGAIKLRKQRAEVSASRIPTRASSGSSAATALSSAAC